MGRLAKRIVAVAFVPAAGIDASACLQAVALGAPLGRTMSGWYEKRTPNSCFIRDWMPIILMA
jgi:hypothetical protein